MKYGHLEMRIEEMLKKKRDQQEYDLPRPGYTESKF